jgi:hypothetical protein
VDFAAGYLAGRDRKRVKAMPLTVADLRTLEIYLAGVLNRSEHHAKTVGAIALALIGAVLWKKDPVPIEVAHAMAKQRTSCGFIFQVRGTRSPRAAWAGTVWPRYKTIHRDEVHAKGVDLQTYRAANMNNPQQLTPC